MAPSLTNFGELTRQVLRFLGITQASAHELQIAQDLVREGYQMFLLAHDWSFLVKPARLTTDPQVNYVRLPYDFESLETPFTYEANSPTDLMAQRSYHQLLTLRQENNCIGNPVYFALSYDETLTATSDTLPQVVFWPTPATVMTFDYSYRFRPDKLEQDSHVPPGSRLYGTVIKACCLAMAELHEDGKAGPENTHAQQMIAQAIIKDQRRSPDTLGSYLAIATPVPRGRNGIAYDNS